MHLALVVLVFYLQNKKIKIEGSIVKDGLNCGPGMSPNYVLTCALKIRCDKNLGFDCFLINKSIKRVWTEFWLGLKP